MNDRFCSLRKGVLLLFLGLLSYHGFAQVPVRMKVNESVVELTGKHFNIYFDSTNKLKASEVISKIEHPNISWPANEALYNNRFLNKNLWLKVKIENADLASEDYWLLEFPDFHISEIEVFQVENDLPISLGRQGYLLPFDSRPLSYKNPIFRIQPKENRYFLIRLNSETANSYKISVTNPGWKLGASNHQYLTFGLYYGLFLLLLINSLIFFGFIRQWMYVWYVVYLLIFIFQSLTNNGIGFQYLWPDLPDLNRVYDITTILLVMSFVIYSNAFLKLRERLPQAGKWMILSTIIYVLVFIYDSILFQIHQVNSWVLLIPFGIVYFSAVKLYFMGYKESRFFIIGYTSLLIGIAIRILMRYGFLPDNHLGVYSMDYGFLLEALFFSVAMGDRFRLSNQQVIMAQKEIINQQEINKALQEKVNLELEEKVKQKTEELSEKNKELTLMTGRLNEMNATLDKDNWKIGKEKKEAFLSSILNKKFNYQEFSISFPDDLSCKRFIHDLKWEENYECRKCGNGKWHEGGIAFARKCSKCNSRETITANTLFHRTHLPLQKAFYIVYITLKYDGQSTLQQIEDETGLSKSAVSLFRKKVRSTIDFIGKKHPTFEEVLLFSQKS